MVVPCKEEQRSQAAHQACNRTRSGLTHWVTGVDAAYLKLCKAFKIIESGQLRFLGLTEVEVASALARWVRTGELEDADANRIESAFNDDVRQGRFVRCPIDAAHYQRAVHWIGTRKTSLRTLDALHMACAEHLQACLITEDEVLFNAAVFFGLDAEKPTGY